MTGGSGVVTPLGPSRASGRAERGVVRRGCRATKLPFLHAAGEGEDPAAVDVAVEGEGHFAEDGGSCGLAHFPAQGVLGVADGAVGGEEAIVPGGGLVVMEDIGAGVVEGRAVVG